MGTLAAARAAQQVPAAIQPAIRPPTHWFIPLLPKQATISELVAAGLTTKEIGAWLNMSRSTVDNQVYQVFVKLNLWKRVQIRDWVRANRPRASTRWHAPLNSWQADLAHLVSARLTNTEIATRLGMSTYTVDHHVARVFSMLDLAKRAELIEWVATNYRLTG